MENTNIKASYPHIATVSWPVSCTYPHNNIISIQCRAALNSCKTLIMHTPITMVAGNLPIKKLWLLGNGQATPNFSYAQKNVYNIDMGVAWGQG